MKIPFQQDTFSGCALYTLANLFNDRRFLDGVKDLKVGSRTVDMNRKMDLYQPHAYVSDLFVTNSHFTKQHNRLMDEEVFTYLIELLTPEAVETWARPLAVSFLRPSGMCHSILVLHNVKDDLLYIFDSMHQEREIMDKYQFIHTYHILEVANFGLWDHPSPDHSMYCIKENWPHLFLPGE